MKSCIGQGMREGAQRFRALSRRSTSQDLPTVTNQEALTAEPLQGGYSGWLHYVGATNYITNLGDAISSPSSPRGGGGVRVVSPSPQLTGLLLLSTSKVRDSSGGPSPGPLISTRKDIVPAEIPRVGGNTGPTSGYRGNGQGLAAGTTINSWLPLLAPFLPWNFLPS